MKLSEFTQHLSGLKKIAFELPSGKLVPEHFHVTEIGRIDKNFIDCGGTIRKEQKISFQLWQANDYNHRLHPEKLIHNRTFDFRFTNHLNEGEISLDFFTRVSFPIGDKGNIKISINPIEYFEMDTFIRNERASRDQFPKGFAIGDLLIETNTVIFNSNKSQVLFNIGLKTASGSQFRNARYTDSPAYYLNLSYYIEKKINEKFSIDLGGLLGLLRSR